MSTNTSTAQTNIAAAVSSAADAAWRYMTSVRAVRHADGREEPFSTDTLRASLWHALELAGMRPSEFRRTDRMLGQIISRLNHRFDGIATPTTSDIAEMVITTLIDNNLAFVARKYIAERQGLGPVAEKKPTYGNGITVARRYTTRGQHPFEAITWDKRTAVIKNEKGKLIFEQKDVEVPDFWSQTAVNIVVSKYFTGRIGDADRETSAKQLIGRVADTISDWGRCDGYFATEDDADAFQAELNHILIHQMAAFNSPVWFNVGVHPHPQCSACFINSVEDDMRSIMNLATTEAMLFKYGSGTGSNLSKLRSAREYLGGSQGKSSGVTSFMKGWDSFAGVVKSGGKTRRAAKMVILNVEHPDIVDFIECKMKEEKKAWALIEAGYDGSFTGEAYSSIFFQNANNSVRVTDAFMQAVESDSDFSTVEVTTGKTAETFKAREMMRKMAQAAWHCGDPGVQYDTTINRWHTSKNTDRINGSNPCSEYMFLDDTACNLSSLNLMKFRKGSRLEQFDVESYEHALEIMITAMDILVGNSSYPTPAIEQNSFDFRPLGIGYANLGALLMSRGLAYDSDEARHLSAALTSIMSGRCYAQSAKIAARVGPFAGFEENREPCLEVLKMHGEASTFIPKAGVPKDVWEASLRSWENANTLAQQHGVRNAQISVLAPTGTISFLMDCDTTGVEPDIALVKYKWMVDGGMEKLINRTVPEALLNLGYTEAQMKEMTDYILANDTIEGAPGLKESDLPVFDCAFKAAKGTRSIHYMGHVRMMAATQPFLSGAISKTVNMPENATVEEVEHVYMEGWRLGLKAIAIYRDGSKRQQPLTTSIEQKQKNQKARTEEAPAAEVKVVEQAVASLGVTMPSAPRRHRMPDERRSITHRFSVGGHKGYITVGLYDDGKPGEIFITMSKEGSVMAGLVSALASSVSIALQYGVPLEALVNRFAHTRFEPSGFTNNPHIKIAKSIVDYVFRWLGQKFLDANAQKQLGIQSEGPSLSVVDAMHTPLSGSDALPSTPAVAPKQADLFHAPAPATSGGAHTMTFDNQSDAPACGTCGSIMVRNAACYKCLNCGSTSGCS